ncbi:MAG: phosphatidylglycerol lysyltransferase domain-containing protein [Treponema sp.]|nr:phosphatidylglycerol lysyltransferase domain-containing protein [Treponema sp.]
MTIPNYPEFASLTMDFKNELTQILSRTGDGVSEFSFAGLYLFRDRYRYRICTAGDSLIISGIQPPKNPGEPERSFFMIPGPSVDYTIIDDLFRTHDFWKNIPDSIAVPCETQLKEHHITVAEDRDNFDYLYLRSELSELTGKKFHKKRNLVAQFTAAYTCTGKPFSPEFAAGALEVLQGWEEEKESRADYDAALEAIKLSGDIGLSGVIFFIEDKPVAFCLGESMGGGKFYTIQFEKALEEYKGIYQFINQAFAASLSPDILYINREQDLGDEGLRQAKESYRPAGFVRKYTGVMS